ncbi:MAG: RNA-binding S4 domain-containing protein [Xanthobacteraceae bacterium]
MAIDRQRIDKWLWHARVVRTRSAAAALVASNHVRLNGGRIDAPSQTVKRDDVVTIALDRRVRVLKVAGFAERRGDAGLAVTLYEDLSPAPPARPAEPLQAVRNAGTGRPTKAERRAWSRLVDGDGY